MYIYIYIQFHIYIIYKYILYIMYICIYDNYPILVTLRN